MRDVALCLSGGGFRATLFHLGVLQALRELGQVRRLCCIASVSGGSVLAAHAISNWDRYVGSEEQAQFAEKDLINFVQRDIRGRVVRRAILTSPTMLLPKRFSSLRLGLVDHLEREYRRLYRSQSIAQAYQHNQQSPPELHILATNLMTGNLVSFSRRGYQVEDAEETALHSTDALPLSFAVAASSAFPPLFPPVAITRELLAESEMAFPVSPQPLTDAGVFDNIGVEKALRLIARDEMSARTLLLSDATAPFDWRVGDSFSGIVSRNIRATDILMNRVAKMTLDRIHDRAAPLKVVHIPIQQMTNTDRKSVV